MQKLDVLDQELSKIKIETNAQKLNLNDNDANADKGDIVFSQLPNSDQKQDQPDYIKQVTRKEEIQRVRSQRTFKETEVIKINDDPSNSKYPNNTIDTAKYNILTFLPKALLYQFYRLANIYFLFIAIIQSIPVISPLSSTTAIAPICIVITASLIREAIEDIVRHKYDTKLNEQPVKVYRQGMLVTSTSASLRVGEVITLIDKEQAPADVLIIDTAKPGGTCYTETATLDGEKTLKTRVSPKDTAGIIFDTKDKDIAINNNLEHSMAESKNRVKKANSIRTNGMSAPETLYLRGQIIRDTPNPNLHSFDGNLDLKISYKNNESDGENTLHTLPSIPVDITNMLLRGSIVKNTPILIAIVVYTGHKTKLMLNSKKGRVKYSELEKMVSKLLIVILILQSILCIVAAAVYDPYFIKNLAVFSKTIKLDNYGYPSDSIINYFTYLLLLNTMIPISLIITLEIVKTIQGFFISVDCKGYSTVRKAFIKAGSISLNEELGNVNFIFSDKTGTLTCNKMSFKYAIIGDRCFDLKAEERIKLDDVLSIETNEDVKKIQDQRDEYFRLLAIAHECASQEENGVFDFTGASPDDVELVYTASRMGYSCMPSVHPGVRTVKDTTNDDNTFLDYSIENLIEFSSKRKRMSIVFSKSETQESNRTKTVPDSYLVYIKGADSEIKKRLKNIDDSEISMKVSKCAKYISYFANQGLRVLMLGKKEISHAQFMDFKEKFNIASLDILNKESAIERVCDEFEQNFELVGATVVEDKLQDKVPETIMKLKLAGIKVWMLTGDSVDTAKKIGLSCNLISIREKVFELVGDSDSDIQNFFTEYKEYMEVAFRESEYKLTNNPFIENSPSKSSSGALKKTTSDFSIVLASTAITRIFKSDKLAKDFLTIASQAKAVIGCRVSPMQKADVVREMKKFDPNAKTLSIGDGGNDVSMILEANIGIGVYGEEGMRAVQASDYAIGEFKILERLLFFHGRVNLLRISKLIYYFFFKNFVFTLAHFFFLFLNNASGQSIFEDWFITFYNLIYTALPIGLLGCTEIDVREEDGKLIEKITPFLYKVSRDNPMFTKSGFIFQMIRGLLIGLAMFIFINFALEESFLNSDGQPSDLWTFSFIYFTSILLLVTLSLLIHNMYLTKLMIAITLASCSVYFLTLIYFHNSVTSNSSGSYTVLLTSSRTYLIIILNIVVGITIELILKNFEYLVYPSLTRLIMRYISSSDEVVNNLDKASATMPFSNYLEKYDKIVGD